HGAVVLDGFPAAAREHEPGAAHRAALPGALATNRPGAGHAQVGVEREPALEAQEQVLAVSVDGAERAPGQLLRPTVAAMARLRHRDPLRRAPPERRPDAVGRAVDRVALGHPLRA